MDKDLMQRLDRFDPSWALSPIWEGDTVYNESVVMVPDKNGDMRAPLLYHADQILSVSESLLQT